MHRSSTTLAVVGVMLVALGCKGLSRSDATEKGAPGAGVQKANPQEQTDAQLSNKLEGYIQCLNRATHAAVAAKESYLSRVDEATGPTGKETGVWIRSLEVTPCLQALDRAKALLPSLPDVDETVSAYRSALETLVPLVKQVHDYYDQKNFKDDNWAKGKELHAPLMAAFVRFSQANEPFQAKVVGLNEAIQARRLDRLQKDPQRRLQYLIEYAVRDAKTLMKLAEVEELSKLDANAFGERLQGYEKAVGDLEQYVAGHKDEADKVLLLNLFMQAETDYLKATKELMRRKRDNRDFNRDVSGNPIHVDGHPAQVLEKYNAMINQLNMARFRE